MAYRDLSEPDLTDALVDAGLPQPYAAVLADSDREIARGALEVTSGDLERLIGRAPTTMTDAVADAVGRRA